MVVAYFLCFIRHKYESYQVYRCQLKQQVSLQTHARSKIKLGIFSLFFFCINEGIEWEKFLEQQK